MRRGGDHHVEARAYLAPMSAKTLFVPIRVSSSGDTSMRPMNSTAAARTFSPIPCSVPGLPV